MYFAVGWPKYYGTDDNQPGQPCGFKFNRDRTILAVITNDKLTLWYCHVSTPSQTLAAAAQNIFFRNSWIGVQ